jgi:hypothetical protein
MVLLDSAGKYSRIGDAERIRKWLAAQPPAVRACSADDPPGLAAASRATRSGWCRARRDLRAVALTRSSQDSSSRSAGADIDSPATSLAWSSKMPAAMQRTPSSSSSSSRARPLLRTEPVRAPEPAQVGDAVAGVAGQAGARGIGTHPLRVVMGQEQLAHRGEVQRCAAAHGAHHLHARAFAVGALDVDDLVALAHRQVHRLVGELVQFAHRRHGSVAHVQPGLHQVAQFQQPHAQPVAAGLGPVDEAAAWPGR